MALLKLSLLLFTFAMVKCDVLVPSTGAGMDNDAMKLQVIFQEIQFTLARLNAPEGMASTDLAKMAHYIAAHCAAYVYDLRQTVNDMEIRAIITQAAGDYNNFASLTALFDDSVSLEASKLDEAFVLLNNLAMMLKSGDASTTKHIVVAAIGKVAAAIEQTVSSLHKNFHYVTTANAMTQKRDTTVTGHVERGPGGTSGGVSVSHTWKNK